MTLHSGVPSLRDLCAVFTSQHNLYWTEAANCTQTDPIAHKLELIDKPSSLISSWQSGHNSSEGGACNFLSSSSPGLEDPCMSLRSQEPTAVFLKYNWLLVYE